MILPSPLQCLLVVLVGKLSAAILTGPSTNQTIDNKGEVRIAPGSEDQVAQNTTFFYEANAFLISKDDAEKVSKTSRIQSDVGGDLSNSSVPASHSMTSARNGRMLDLDALVGDFAASRAKKERALTGNRQSRYLSSAPSLDVGGGKKLHIQGFIPIVGIKDTSDDDADSDQEQAASKQHHQKAQLQSSELPFAQSSIGHASIGVQRYLNSEQQIDAKYSGAGVVDSLKKPLKKLTGLVGSGSESQYSMQNCHCVPFYMCKNGFISESSLGKAQVQQMIQQQQSHQQQSNQWNKNGPNQQMEMKSSQMIVVTPQPQLITESSQFLLQPQDTDSYIPVDERSLDRESITSSDGSIEGLQNNQSNTNSSNQENFHDQQQLSQPVAGDPIDNSTDFNQNSDFSQEILGRMLGIKSPSRSSGSSSSGVCGLLRSCCNIPTHLFPSQQDLANDQYLAAQLSSSAHSSARYQQIYPPSKQSPHKFSSHIDPMSQQQHVIAPQRYQQQQQQQQSVMSQAANRKFPYGFPSQISQTQPMQPLNTPQFGMDTSLAHRSNLFQSNARYQQPQVAQFTRATPQLQHLQSFQQPHQEMKALPVPISALASNQFQQVAPQPGWASTRTNLGTRKILEGRCGLRQSAGITGRVQNLQYHESSADFGEFPAQAAILKRLGNSESLFVCGGTLISQYWVATAAHCIKKHPQSDLKIRLGEWDVHRDDEFYPFVEKEVRNLIVHPEFVAGNLVNDIALLRLDSPVDASLPHVNPACLPSTDETFTRQHCWVTGWGKDSFGQKGSFQAVLRKVELPVVGQNECENALRQTRLGPHYRLHSGFICAGGEGGKDACEGDGGSGLYCIQEGIIKAVGLVSWGIGCGQAGVPGVYVNLAHYRPWIENIISIDEDIYSPYSNLIGSSLISERSSANKSTTDEITTQQPSDTTTQS